MAAWYRHDDRRQVLILSLYIQPGAKRTEVAGLHGEALKIRIAAPPVDGAANDELTAFLKKTLGVPASHIRIKHGLSGRSKVVEIQPPCASPEVLLQK
ncbi:MAG: DUF167 domain-containing protein [Burkholderiales bacterium]